MLHQLSPKYALLAHRLRLIPFSVQFVELPNNLKGGKVAEWQSDEPKTQVDACRCNEGGWHGLNTEANGNCGRLNTTK